MEVPWFFRGARASNFDKVSVLRLQKIAERNRIRAGLPLLSVPKELRRVKEAADTEKFRSFGHVYRERVHDKMLRQQRRGRGDPTKLDSEWSALRRRTAV